MIMTKAISEKQETKDPRHKDKCPVHYNGVEQKLNGVELNQRFKKKELTAMDTIRNPVRRPGPFEFSASLESTFSAETWERLKDAKMHAKQIVIAPRSTFKRITKRQKQKRTLVGLLGFVVFIGVYFQTLFLQFQISDCHQLERSMTNYITGSSTSSSSTGSGGSLVQMKTLDDIWDFYETRLLSDLFPMETWYNGDAFEEDEKGYLLNYNKLGKTKRACLLRSINIFSLAMRN